jgi:hypothetical protein
MVIPDFLDSLPAAGNAFSGESSGRFPVFVFHLPGGGNRINVSQ